MVYRSLYLCFVVFIYSGSWSFVVVRELFVCGFFRMGNVFFS